MLRVGIKRIGMTRVGMTRVGIKRIGMTGVGMTCIIIKVLRDEHFTRLFYSWVSTI